MTKIKTTPRTATVLMVLVWGLCCHPLAAEPTTGEREASLAGRVSIHAQPLAAVTVYAYDVASYALEKVLTDRQGLFLFAGMPAGLYKIVAFKEGFVPAVELLMRRSREDSQFVELRLVEGGDDDVRDAQHYWDARQRIPVDVLREILTLEAAGPEAGLEIRDASLFEAKMAALGGVENMGSLGQAQLTSAEVGIKGALGQMKVGVDGHYQQLVPLKGGTMADGAVRTMALHLASPDQSKITLTTTMSELGGAPDDGPGPVDLERYQVRYSGGTKRGKTAISAQYVEESRFYQSGAVDLAEIPEASQTWNIEGSYSRGLSDRTSLKTGLSYRQRLSDLELTSPSQLAGSALDGSLRNDTVDLYTVADSRIEPRVVVEYGLYSSLRDGQLSLMPHGGLVIELGSDWKARTSISRRVESDVAESDLYPRFTSAFYSDAGSCRQVGEACYEVVFAHSDGDLETFSVGAIHREYAETLRLYFSDDFFDRLESVFLVRGDEVPELQFRFVRQIAPRVLAKLESNFASGGGGIFYATDQQPYENQVRYLVTSLDTRFQRTSTGVFIAFHHLEQDLNPIDPAPGRTGSGGLATGVEVERLQVMLTQDLNALVDMAAKLAIRLNMELSRGATPYALTSSNDTYKTLTGGISVSF